MKILIDARALSPHLDGIGRYIFSLIGIFHQQKINHLVIISTKETATFLTEAYPQLNIKISSSSRFSMFPQLNFNKLVAAYNPSLMLAASFLASSISLKFKTILIIYDFLFLSESDFFCNRPYLFRPFLKFYLFLQIRKSLKNTAAHACISSATMNDLNAFFPTIAKGFYIGAGIAPIFLNQFSSVSSPSHNYVLLVGNIKSYKNLENQIIAFAIISLQFSDMRLKLLIKHDHSTRHISHLLDKLNISDKCDFLGYVSDKELLDLYKNAILVLFVSKKEGFGFPLAEAMAVGTPVITSNTSSLNEIFPNNAVNADPMNPQDIACKIKHLLSNEALKLKTVNSGIKLSQCHRWEFTVKRILDFSQNNL
jgi:glycosyltransferase involved in cell wall biosynthesis